MNRRESWLDDAKCVGIICVILGHIIGFYNEDSAYGTNLVQGIIVSFNMPLFFILSGYTFNLNKEWSKVKVTMDYCIKTTRRLLIPALSTASILWLFQLTSDLLNTFWFLNILWRILLVYSIVICLTRLSSNSKIVFMGGQVVFIVICMFLGNRTSEFCWYFLIGIYLRQTHLIARKKILVIMSFIMYILILPIIIKHNFYDEGFLHLLTTRFFYLGILRVLAGSSFCFCILSILKTVSRKYSNISKLGTMTLGIYTIHSVYVIFIGKKLLKLSIKTGMNTLDWSLICVATILALSISILTILVMRKNKNLKMIFLGEYR